MSLLVNLRHVERENLELEGELPVKELDLAGVDEFIHVEEPLHYELEAQKLTTSVLAQGSLSLDLEVRVRPLPETLRLSAGIARLGVSFALGRRRKGRCDK